MQLGEFTELTSLMGAWENHRVMRPEQLHHQKSPTPGWASTRQKPTEWEGSTPANLRVLPSTSEYSRVLLHLRQGYIQQWVGEWIDSARVPRLLSSEDAACKGLRVARVALTSSCGNSWVTPGSSFTFNKDILQGQTEGSQTSLPFVLGMWMTSAG